MTALHDVTCLVVASTQRRTPAGQITSAERRSVLVEPDIAIRIGDARLSDATRTVSSYHTAEAGNSRKPVRKCQRQRLKCFLHARVVRSRQPVRASSSSQPRRQTPDDALYQRRR